MKRPRFIKRQFKGKNGMIKTYAWRMFGKAWMIAISETKWHAGERFKRAPIWIASIKDEIPALFIWKLAIGFHRPKPKHETEVDPS